MDIHYEPFHTAWRIDDGHELTRNCAAAFGHVFGRDPDGFDFWDFSTNAVTPVSMGIPTIGFGPGHEHYAHAPNECVEVEHLVKASAFYARFVEAFAAEAKQ